MAHLSEPPIDIALKHADAQAPEGETIFAGVRRVTASGPIDTMPGFSSGSWWVQDVAATLPVRLLGDVRGRRIADLCAAPGGKTLQLAASGATVTAVDMSSERLNLVRENLSRTGLEAAIVQADLRDFAPDARFDGVLLDAPCSATGTIRRHPELAWIKGAADIAQCARAASDLLESAAELVRPGGVLVFAVCSLEPEEGSEQISDFLARHEDFTCSPVSESEVSGHGEWIDAAGHLRTLPCHLGEKGGMDGFFAARLTRRS